MNWISTLIVGIFSAGGIGVISAITAYLLSRRKMASETSIQEGAAADTRWQHLIDDLHGENTRLRERIDEQEVTMTKRFAVVFASHIECVEENAKLKGRVEDLERRVAALVGGGAK